LYHKVRHENILHRDELKILQLGEELPRQIPYTQNYYPIYTSSVGGKEIMKLTNAAALALLTPLLWLSPVRAENPDHVQQLLETRACMGCDLSGADLSVQHLIGADLRNADLSGANLTEANLEGADLTGANLEGANLTDAFLNQASLHEANLDHVNFTGASLIEVDVTEASMEDLTIKEATIYNTQIGVGGTAPEPGEDVEF